MKALGYHGPGEKAWESAEDPAIQDPTDVIVKVDTTTICGTDLHILKGDVPDGVRDRRPERSREAWRLGGRRRRRAGWPGRDHDQRWPARAASSRSISRRRASHAKEFGATHALQGGEDVERQVADLTDGMGVNVAMEAVGIPETFDLCTRLVRPGGLVANIGVHGAPATLHLEELWIKNITITTGWSAAPPCPRCSSSCATRDSTPRSSAPITSSSARSCRPTTCSSAADENDALKVVLSA